MERELVTLSQELTATGSPNGKMAERPERPERPERQMVERLGSAYDSLLHRIAELEEEAQVKDRAINDAIVALKSRDVEVEGLKLQLMAMANQTAVMQSACDDRVWEYQRERDSLKDELKEFRQIFKWVQEIKIPAPRPPVRERPERKSKIKTETIDEGKQDERPEGMPTESVEVQPVGPPSEG